MDGIIYLSCGHKKDSSESCHKDEVVLFCIELKMGLDGNMGIEPPKEKLKFENSI